MVDVCTFNKLKIDTLPNFDIELIFLNLRAKSVGESTNLTLQCNNCENKINFELDITKAEVKKDPAHTTKILISDKIVLEMRYPKFEEMINIYQNFKSDKIVDLLSSCIKSVYTEDAIYEEYTQEELLEFVNSFSKSQFELIENFFLTMPKLVQHIEKDCTLSHEGLHNFFKLNFSLVKNHNYSLSEIENMIPWERDVYVAMLINHINEENERKKQKQIRNNQE